MDQTFFDRIQLTDVKDGSNSTDRNTQDWLSDYVGRLWTDRNRPGDSAKSADPPAEPLPPKDNPARTPTNMEASANNWSKLIGDNFGQTSLGRAITEFGRELLTEKLDPKKLGGLVAGAQVGDRQAAQAAMERLNQHLDKFGYQLEVDTAADGRVKQLNLIENGKPGEFSVSLAVNAKGEATPQRLKVENFEVEKKNVTLRDCTRYISSTLFDAVKP